jgi:CDP-glucose 4,6-dehydratase
MDLSFYRNKRVFLTGHTGFKGTWLCKLLQMIDAEVTGYALAPQSDDARTFFEQVVGDGVHSVVGDIRDLDRLEQAFRAARPELVIHLAAQPIVLTGYRQPQLTYETNVMGTVNLLECVRRSECVQSVLNVTTDKVYQNQEWTWGYREIDPLDGYDPYSNSKSCSELVTHSYKKSFLSDKEIAVSTARAGNVIGGGDFAENRIIPDCIRAAVRKQTISVRNPASTRPYQHVLEPLYAYLLILAGQCQDHQYEGYYNVGPDGCDCLSTGDLVALFCKHWGEGQDWYQEKVSQPHEAAFLKLDCSKLKQVFHWHPRWHIDEAVKRAIEWSKVYYAGGDISACTEEQIQRFLEDGMR